MGGWEGNCGYPARYVVYIIIIGVGLQNSRMHRVDGERERDGFFGSPMEKEGLTGYMVSWDERLCDLYFSLSPALICEDAVYVLVVGWWELTLWNYYLWSLLGGGCSMVGFMTFC